MTTTSIDWTKIKSGWKDLKGRFKQQWGKLTDNDLTRIEGDRDRLAARLQELYGIGKEQAFTRVDEFVAKL